MQKENDHIIQLIASYCEGSITSKEIAILKDWYKKDKKNRTLFHQYLKTYHDHRSVGMMSYVDVDVAWKTIQRKIRPAKTFRIKRFLPYAAAILLPIALGVVLYLKTYDPEDNNLLELSEAPIIKPGTKQATLVLSDGKKVSLLENADIKETDGTNINLNEKNIVYQKNETAAEKVLLNTLYVPRKGEANLVLADGTKVWLNSESQLVYPTSFKGDKREVMLSSGEAYFEVVENPDKPFYVKANGASIKVLGTSFNIKAYEDDEKIETTLLEGKVSITNESHINKSSIELKPGYQAVIRKGEAGMHVKEVDPFVYISWKDGIFAFEDLTLEEIMKTFGRWYDLEIFYENESLKNLHFTGNLVRYKNINPHLKIISRSTNVNFKLSEESVLIYKD